MRDIQATLESQKGLASQSVPASLRLYSPKSPIQERSPRFRNYRCHNCQQLGHLKRECPYNLPTSGFSPPGNNPFVPFQASIPPGTTSPFPLMDAQPSSQCPIPPSRPNVNCTSTPLFRYPTQVNDQCNVSRSNNPTISVINAGSNPLGVSDPDVPIDKSLSFCSNHSPFSQSLEYPIDSNMVIHGRLGEVESDMLLDTGSCISVVDAQYLPAVGNPPIAPASFLNCRSFKGLSSPILGSVSLPVQMGRFQTKFMFYVVNNMVHDVVLGRDFYGENVDCLRNLE